MSGTKFMVIKFKELLKTAVFAVLGVIIIIALIYFLVPRGGDKSTSYVPGIYTSEIYLDNELINVEVTVNDSKIKSVDLVHTTETLPVFYPLFESTAETIGKSIVKNQSLDVDIPSEAAVTGKLIIDAVGECLAKAEMK